MDVYVSNWFQSGLNDNYITVWNTLEEAYQQVCAEILTSISNEWDLTDPDCQDIVRDINDAFLNNNYEEVISLYNNWENRNDYPQNWSVCKSSIKTNPKQGTVILLNHSDSEGEIPNNQVIFQANSAGATCRGCGNFNEHAYADRADGSFHCYQCRTFSQICS